MKKIIVILILCLLAGLPGVARTLYVAPEGTVPSPTQPFTNGWNNAATNIQNAVDNAVDDDIILVSNGTYTLTVTNIVVTNAITVRSWNAGAVDRAGTVVNGGGAVRCFNVSHAGAVLEGLTVTNGVEAVSGGGIYLAAGLVTNCIISGNSSSNGGGIYLSSANSTLKNSLVAGNVSTNTYFYKGGGGLWLAAGLVTNCVISNNVAVRSGGGAYLTGGKLTDSEIITNRTLNGAFGHGGGGILIYNNSAATVANCTIMGNAYATVSGGEGGGGGVAVISGGVVTNCVIVYNRTVANWGGGVYFQGITDNRIYDCLIGNNTASRAGGGVQYYQTARGVMVNCRIVDNVTLNGSLDGGGGIYGSTNMVLRQALIIGNSAGYRGGGMYAVGGSISSCTIASNYAGAGGGGIMFLDKGTVLTNTIIFSNKTGAVWTDFEFSGGTASLYNCGTPVTNTSLVADNCVTNSPRFMDFARGNYRLAASSSYINAGTNEAWMETAVDLFGQPRIRYGRVDIGGYEYFLNVKVNGIPIDRVRRINGVDKNRIFRISE